MLLLAAEHSCKQMHLAFTYWSKEDSLKMLGEMCGKLEDGAAKHLFHEHAKGRVRCDLLG